VRFETTASFDADFRRLSREEKEKARSAIRAFSDACDRWLETRGRSGWPAALRVKPVQAAPGIFEMTWSFSGPDGRATWEWATTLVEDREVPVIRWRRIGGHAIFDRP
jgi:hypothetical protein